MIRQDALHKVSYWKTYFFYTVTCTQQESNLWPSISSSESLLLSYWTLHLLLYTVVGKMQQSLGLDCMVFKSVWVCDFVLYKNWKIFKKSCAADMLMKPQPFPSFLPTSRLDMKLNIGLSSWAHEKWILLISLFDIFLSGCWHSFLYFWWWHFGGIYFEYWCG